jgi:hypothetical protein
MVLTILAVRKNSPARGRHSISVVKVWES